MSYSLPPWNNASEWMTLLEEMRANAGASAISLYISLESGDISYAVGEEDEVDEADPDA